MKPTALRGGIYVFVPGGLSAAAGVRFASLFDQQEIACRREMLTLKKTHVRPVVLYDSCNLSAASFRADGWLSSFP